MQAETVICLSPRMWHSLWRDTQPLMWRIAQHNRVIFFEPGRNPDRPVWAEMRRSLPSAVGLEFESILDTLIVVQAPPQLPLARQRLPAGLLRMTTPLIVSLNAWALTRHIRRVMRALNVVRQILWLYGPFHHGIVGKIGEKLDCYFNYDEFADFLQNQRISHLIRQYERRLVERVDVVFATSRAQWERRRVINPNTHFVPNGVDFGLLNRALQPTQQVPPDISSCPRPIIGFAGWLGYHINVPLLLRVAAAYPECSLVLVGPNDLPDGAYLNALRLQRNVFFLGRKDRSLLPDYLREFDVALMPYMLEGHVLSAFPLKLHEYLAAGRDIVATDLPELQPYRHLMHIAPCDDEFVEMVGRALDSESSVSVEDRVAIARENTWDHRIEQIYSILDPLLITRGN